MNGSPQLEVNKEKVLYSACPALPNAQRGAGLTRKILLTYLHLRLLHSTTYNTILKSLPGPSSTLHLELFKQKQETASLLTWEVYTAKILPESFPKLNSVPLSK